MRALLPSNPSGPDAAVEPMQTSMLSEDGPPRRRCQLFPIKILGCCPCLSSTWTVIQDWLHLVLVFGVLASIACVVQMVVEPATRGECDSLVCYKRWMAVVCLGPSLFWFIITIRHYDAELQDKKRDRQKEVDNLIDTHNRQAEEMNEICTQIAENANAFAGGRFDDKADILARFLKHVQHNLVVYEDEETLDKLRKFVAAWFQTFSQAFLDPGSNFWMNIIKDYTEAATVDELCETSLRNIGEVKFNLRNMQVAAPVPMINERGPRSFAIEEGRRCGVTWLRFYRCGKAIRLLHNRPVSYDEWRATEGQQHSEEAQIRTEWRRLRMVQGCGCQRGDKKGMPYDIMFCCGRLRILSGMHLNFMVLFFADIALLAFEAWSKRPITFLLVLINEICTISVLCCFEQINEIAVLDREIALFQERLVEVTGKHEEAKKDWDHVNNLHDLWKYRTLPTLSIMHKATVHLEDKVNKLAVQDGLPDEPAAYLDFVTQSMNCLDLKLGDVRNTNIEDWKSTIGVALGKLEKMDDLPRVLEALHMIDSEHVVDMLEDAPARSSPTSSPTGSFIGPPSSSPRTSFSGPGAAPRGSQSARQPADARPAKRNSLSGSFTVGSQSARASQADSSHGRSGSM